MELHDRRAEPDFLRGSTALQHYGEKERIVLFHSYGLERAGVRGSYSG